MLFVSFNWAHAQKRSDFYLGKKKIFWKSKKHDNRYFYDFNGNGTVDAMDVYLPNGGHDHYTQRKNGRYTIKVKVRIKKKEWSETTQIRKKNFWYTIRKKNLEKDPKKAHLARLTGFDYRGRNKVELDYKLKNNANKKLIKKKNNLKTSFPQIVSMSEKRMSHEKALRVDNSCLEQCLDMYKFSSTTSLEDRKKECSRYLKDQFFSMYQRGPSCLIKKGKAQGKLLVQKMLSLLHLDESVVIKCNQKQESVGVASFPFENEKKISLNLVNLSDSAKDKSLEKAFFRETIHLTGELQGDGVIDVTKSCTECCYSNNPIACKMCAISPIKLKKYSKDQIKLSDIFIYEKPYSQKEKTSYYNRLEKILLGMSFEDHSKNLYRLTNWKKDKLIENMYSNFLKQTKKESNSRGDKKLRYSDIWAELMASVACAHKQKKSENSKCKVLYLARSIPASFCYEKENKQKCKYEYLKNYFEKKKTSKEGIRLPANFIDLAI